MAATYHLEYDGCYVMQSHDARENGLARWFDNYKNDRYAAFCTDYEWLEVEEIRKHGKKCYVCLIGDDGRGTTRKVEIDYTAPPPPLLTFAAKRVWQPPPPKTPTQLRQERDWNRYHHGEQMVRIDVLYGLTMLKSPQLLLIIGGAELPPPPGRRTAIATATKIAQEKLT